MKKMIFKYLDCKFPNFYMKKTKFGLLPVCNRTDEYTWFRTDVIVEELTDYFYCDNEYAEEVFGNWIRTKPVVEKIPLSTNDLILVHEQYLTSSATSLSLT